MNATVIAIVIVLLIVIAVLAVLYMQRQRRSRALKERFGPEYDRTVEETGGRQKAEAELQQRQERRQSLQIRDLAPEARERYRQSWQDVQAEFVDAPSAAVRKADELIGRVMRDRGYPVEDFDQRAADISVDHAHALDDYRAAHEIAQANAQNRASTEDLRRAMQHYRSLFAELLGDQGRSKEESPGAVRKEEPAREQRREDSHGA